MCCVRESSAMAADKNVLGFIDAGRKVRRPPLVGMQFLHQRPVSAPDVVGARPRLQAKDLIGLLFRHFAARRTRAPAPLPHHPARAHASRAPGGRDKPSVARGFPRRYRPGKPISVGTSSASSVAPSCGRRGCGRASRRCRDRAPFRRRPSAPATPARCSFWVR